MINAILQSVRIMADGCHNFRVFLVDGTRPNQTQIKQFLDRSLMLVTALSPVIGYDKASKAAHHAYDKDMTLKAACLELGYVDEAEFDKVVNPTKMIGPTL